MKNYNQPHTNSFKVQTNNIICTTGDDPYGPNTSPRRAIDLNH